MVLNNYFIIELDTTPPELTLYAPQYAQYGEVIEFIVEANEKLDPYKQNAYVMFGNKRYDIVLRYDEENNEYVGLFQTNAYVSETCIIYVELYDEVGNKGTVNHLIEIYSSRELSIDYETDICEISFVADKKGIDFDFETRNIDFEHEKLDILYDVDKMVVDFDVIIE